jgi:hypothetical protein
MYCAWCDHRIYKGAVVKVDSLCFHPACYRSYRDFLRELKRLVDDEFSRCRKGDGEDDGDDEEDE